MQAIVEATVQDCPGFRWHILSMLLFTVVLFTVVLFKMVLFLTP